MTKKSQDVTAQRFCTSHNNMEFDNKTALDRVRGHSLARVAMLLLFLFVARTCIITVYRLYFHPLSRFPGPKVAAVTRLHELYYAGVTGSFVDNIQDMHKQYGPIVRINPNELSINDSHFNAKYFSNDKSLSKDPWYYGIGFTNSLVALTDGCFLSAPTL